MLLSLALAAMMLASLLSYDPADPAWSHSGSNAQPSNFVGSAGAWLSDLLFYLFGYMAYLLPVMLIYNAVLLIRSRLPESEDRYQLLAVRWGGFVLTLVSGCALASLHFSTGSQLPLDAGGILGQIAGGSLAESLGLGQATRGVRGRMREKRRKAHHLERGFRRGCRRPARGGSRWGPPGRGGRGCRLRPRR